MVSPTKYLKRQMFTQFLYEMENPTPSKPKLPSPQPQKVDGFPNSPLGPRDQAKNLVESPSYNTMENHGVFDKMRDQIKQQRDGAFASNDEDNIPLIKNFHKQNENPTLSQRRYKNEEIEEVHDNPNPNFDYVKLTDPKFETEPTDPATTLWRLYGTEGFQQINRGLRNGFENEGHKHAAAKMHQLMTEDEAPVGNVYYRGIRTKSLKDRHNLEPGQIARDPGFASVSDTFEGAKDFGKVHRIKIAKKLLAHKMNPDTDSFLRQAYKEAETILGPNTHFRFLGTGEDGIDDYEAFSGEELDDDYFMKEEVVDSKPEEKQFSRSTLGDRMNDFVFEVLTPRKNYDNFKQQLNHDD